MESQVLTSYGNAEIISLRFRVYDRDDVTFDLVRRSCKPKIGRVYDYKSVLAEQSAYVLGLGGLVALEKMCDVLILSYSHGDLKHTEFAVRSVRWKPKFADLMKDGKEVVLYLGCDKYIAGETAIKQILAGPIHKDDCLYPFLTKMTDMAGVPDAQRIHSTF